MIEIKNLSKTFITSNSKVQALDNINLKIEKGDIFGIIGFSGAGKSTLIRCLNRLEEPDSGDILIGGKYITRMDKKELKIARRKIGMIFQQFNLLDSKNVFENIAFPLEIAGFKKPKIQKRVEEILEMVGLSDKAGSYPSQLSGGQKQRVGIARALANEPDVLLSDEATSALDPMTTFSILELLKEINRKLNLTIVLITHELDVLSHICKNMAVIEKGRIVESGPVEKFFTNPESEDEKELTRLLNALGLEVKIFPGYAHPEDMKYATEAALSISTCPTHDDYFLKHLKEKYNVPYLLRYMPIGIQNTNSWLREVAKFFHLEEEAERLIERETAELELALKPIRENLKGKKAMLSAGEVRTLATAVWLKELGMEVVAVRPYHYDEFGEPALDSLIENDPELQVNVGTVQPFETANIIEKNRPDVYLGHNSDNIWAAKSGIPIFPIYGGPNTFVGYAGAFDLARGINRVLKNPAFNKNLRKNVRQPYYSNWYTDQPYKYIVQGDENI